MPRNHDRDQVVREMALHGKSYVEIGERLGISKQRAHQICCDLGLRAEIKEAAQKRQLARVVAPLVSDKAASKPGISHGALRDLLTYDRYSGLWTWRTGQKAGKIAGIALSSGYIQIRIGARCYLAHVLAWFYSFEAWPKNEIDHENRNRGDNRLDNLRQATHIQNLGNSSKRQNNQSGYKGVHFDRITQKWRAEIAHIKLGRFDTAEAAAAAYESAARIRYGQFARF